jgi:hypothetical protein
VQHATGKRFFAPITEPRRAIDIGTGTGTWMLASIWTVLYYTNHLSIPSQEMATEFPECEFLGIDIAPLQPTTVLPRNCSFEIANAFEGSYIKCRSCRSILLIISLQ